MKLRNSQLRSAERHTVELLSTVLEEVDVYIFTHNIFNIFCGYFRTERLNQMELHTF